MLRSKAWRCVYRLRYLFYFYLNLTYLDCIKMQLSQMCHNVDLTEFTSASSYTFVKFGALKAVFDTGIFSRISTLAAACSLPCEKKLSLSKLEHSNVQKSPIFIVFPKIRVQVYQRIASLQASNHHDSRGLLCCDHFSIELHQNLISLISPSIELVYSRLNFRFTQAICNWYVYFD